MRRISIQREQRCVEMFMLGIACFGFKQGNGQQSCCTPVHALIVNECCHCKLGHALMLIGMKLNLFSVADMHAVHGKLIWQFEICANLARGIRQFGICTPPCSGQMPLESGRRIDILEDWIIHEKCGKIALLQGPASVTFRFPHHLENKCHCS
jgi:hypothetical protein